MNSPHIIHKYIIIISIIVLIDDFTKIQIRCNVGFNIYSPINKDCPIAHNITRIHTHYVILLHVFKNHMHTSRINKYICTIKVTKGLVISCFNFLINALKYYYYCYLLTIFPWQLEYKSKQCTAHRRRYLDRIQFFHLLWK